MWLLDEHYVNGVITQFCISRPNIQCTCHSPISDSDHKTQTSYHRFIHHLSYTQIKYRSSYRGPICTPYWIYLKGFLVSWKMSSDVIWTYEFNLNRKLWEWKDRLLGQSISILYDGRGNDINDKSDIFPPFTRKESQSDI